MCRLLLRLELLSKPDMTLGEKNAVLRFLETCRYVHLDTAIADVAADIRRLYKLKTPDSIVAASALYTGAALVTRDTQGFSRIREVRVLAI